LYTATITTGVTDLAGNALAANYVWSFTTGATVDTTAPTVSSTVPASGAVNIPVGNALAVTFSETMAPLTINTSTFLLKQGVTAVSGTARSRPAAARVSYAGVTATFTPVSALTPNTLYTATVTTGVTDLAGNALAATYVWTFTTAAVFNPPPPPTSPTVTSTVPANGATFVTTTANLVANFSTSMNPLSINTATFTLRQGGTQISGTVTYAGLSATFRPANNLAPNTPYTAAITTGAADLAGNTLQSTYQWNFTTGVSAGQTPVCLASFAVLAGTAIIGTGSNVITGDMGVSPGTSVNGFPPGTIAGTMHAGDALAAQAMLDLNFGYLDAVARSVGPVPVAGDIGGQTFTPGLYNSTSSLSISSGDLTLDAKGNVNAVFVFQMASTLTTGSGRQIILLGGAQPFNVFWQVGTSATLGAGSVFQGSILVYRFSKIDTD
jgi:hypothetical protein